MTKSHTPEEQEMTELESEVLAEQERRIHERIANLPTPSADTPLAELLDRFFDAVGDSPNGSEEAADARDEIEEAFGALSLENQRLREDRTIIGKVVSQCGTCTVGYAAEKLSARYPR